MRCRFAYVLAMTGFGAFAQAPCEQLKMLKLTGMAITQAETINADLLAFIKS